MYDYLIYILVHQYVHFNDQLTLSARGPSFDDQAEIGRFVGSWVQRCS